MLSLSVALLSLTRNLEPRGLERSA
ncbi:hypothetical protein F6X68_10265 [Micromonospora sp. AMSO12t]|nr:hypothetical protein F6X68_10265 [Micromonospora sp. AMSO12t]